MVQVENDLEYLVAYLLEWNTNDLLSLVASTIDNVATFQDQCERDGFIHLSMWA